MKPFNLTEWALNHKQIVYFFIVLLVTGGIFSYQNLGRMEDPDFSIRPCFSEICICHCLMSNSPIKLIIRFRTPLAWIFCAAIPAQGRPLFTSI